MNALETVSLNDLIDELKRRCDAVVLYAVPKMNDNKRNDIHGDDWRYYYCSSGHHALLLGIMGMLNALVTVPITETVSEAEQEFLENQEGDDDTQKTF